MQWEDRIGRRLKLRDVHMLLAAVQCGRVHPVGLQLACQPVGSVLRADKHDDATVAGADVRRGLVLVRCIYVQYVVIERRDHRRPRHPVRQRDSLL